MNATSVSITSVSTGSSHGLRAHFQLSGLAVRSKSRGGGGAGGGLRMRYSSSHSLLPLPQPLNSNWV